MSNPGREEEIGVFDPQELELMLRRDPAKALRQMADHLERRELTVSLWNFQGNGMVQDWRRSHFLVSLDVASLNGKREGPPENGSGPPVGRANADPA